MQPELSIIIPVYNCEKYIIRCLGSVLRQQDSDKYEIIVVNDGSTDNTAQKLNKFTPKYKNIKVIHQENAGVSVARNVGIATSHGKYVTFVDGDDMVGVNAKAFDKHLQDSVCENVFDLMCTGTHTDIPKKLTAEYFDKGYFVNMLNVANNTHADIVLGGYVCIDYEGDFVGPMLLRNIYEKQRVYTETQQDKQNVMDTVEIRQSANFALYNREMLDKNNLRFVVNMQLDEDILFCMLAALYANKIATAPDVTYFYNRRQDTLSNIQNSNECLRKYDIAYNQRFAVLLNEIAKMPKCEKLFTHYTKEYVYRIARYILPYYDDIIMVPDSMHACKKCERQDCAKCPVANDVLEHCKQSINRYLSNSNVRT